MYMFVSLITETGRSPLNYRLKTVLTCVHKKEREREKRQREEKRKK
jgi:hypothetical protein